MSNVQRFEGTWEGDQENNFLKKKGRPKFFLKKWKMYYMYYIWKNMYYIWAKNVYYMYYILKKMYYMCTIFQATSTCHPVNLNLFLYPGCVINLSIANSTIIIQVELYLTSGKQNVQTKLKNKYQNEHRLINTNL